jgi:cytoskeleton protein RodZ
MTAQSTLGAYLRRGREQAGLSLDAVAAGSRIVPRLVEALEADRQDLLPAAVYVRGFIRAYCQQTGADTEEALRLYDEQAAPPPALSVKPPAPEAPKRGPARRWGRVAAVSAVGVALCVAAFALLGRRQPDAVASRGNGTPPPVASRPASEPAAPSMPAPEGPGTSDAASEGNALLMTAPPSNGPAAPPAAAGPTKPAGRVLVLRATDTTWVRVQPDGGAVTEETLAPGAVREWRSPGRFRVTLGNAGGVELELDGRALPSLGAAGRVARDVLIPAESEP